MRLYSICIFLFLLKICIVLSKKNITNKIKHVNTQIFVHRLRHDIKNIILIKNFDKITLKAARHLLMNDKRICMSADQSFFSKLNDDYIIINVENENYILLKDIVLSEDPNKYNLFIGYDILNEKQKTADKFLYGLTFNNLGHLIPSSTLNQKLAILKTNSKPTIFNVGSVVVTNSYLSTNEEFDTQENFAISGSVSASVNYGIYSGSASVRGSLSENSNIHKESDFIYIQNIINSIKERIVLNIDDLVPSNFLIDQVIEIAGNNKSIEIIGKNLIKFLNKYGWYFPIDYSIGGALIKNSTAIKSSLQKAEETAKNAGIRVKAEMVAVLSGEIESNASKGKKQNSKSSKETKNDILISFGAGGAMDIESFKINIENKNNWIIVQYTKMIPSLQLLFMHYPHQLNQLKNILIQMYAVSSLKNIQKNINLNRYAFEIAESFDPESQ